LRRSDERKKATGTAFDLCSLRKREKKAFAKPGISCSSSSSSFPSSSMAQNKGRVCRV
jgi:hypothetical protein